MKSKWSIKRLSEVAEIQMGQSPKGSSYNISGEGVPLINGPVEFGETPFSRTKRTKFTTEPTKMCREGDLILCVRGSTTGRMNIAGYDSCIGRGVASIRSEKYQDWINFFIHVNRETIYRLGSGATFPNVSGSMLAKLEIPIPPESEQKRIVAIMDEAFEGIDRAIANTEKNLANSCELFESYLNATFTRKGDGWKEKKLGKIGGKVFTGPFGSLLHKSDYVSNGIPIINPANIEDDKIIPNFNKTVSPDIVKRLQAYILKQNDVVVGRRGEIGRCAVVREEQAGWLCGSGSFFIKPFENVDSVFLAHLLRSAVYRNKLESLSTGATMQNLSNQSLSDLVIAMPSLDEQNRITNKIDDLRTETQRLETIYRQKIAALNELKQSILQKAFTGELTADTPKTAKQEIAA
ncbi:MAG: restriction endonuclease subunit S [Nodularia sp. CChRGM 3473]